MFYNKKNRLKYKNIVIYFIVIVKIKDLTRKRKNAMRNNLRLKQRFLLRKIVLITGVISILLTIGWFFLFQFSNVKNAYAGTNFYSLNNGEWSNSLWSNISNAGSNCGCNPGGNFNKTANISHKITVSSYSPFKMSGGGVVNLIGSGSITFNSNVELSGGSYIDIDPNDTIIINGNLLVSSSNINVDGFFRVNGNATLTGGSTVCGTGTAFLNGTLSGTTWCGGVVLPIKLTKFKVEQMDGAARLSWKTASEINNDYFTVECSKDGKSFAEVLKIDGAGNSNRDLEYSAVDKDPLAGLSYYRLKQTDYDGEFEYSDMIVFKNISGQISKNLTVQSVSPTIISNDFKIYFSLDKKADVDIQIIKYSGELVFKENIKANEGNNSYFFVDNQSLNPGSYIVRIVCNNEIVKKKIIKI